ncbi:MAG: TRIC cation channel family protein [Eggerthellaceae bacterium]|nr:TRIC cation channel family protein [Eggerthellaceae bacterium]
MLESVLDIPYWFELLATVTASIGGAMVATRARYDIFGVIVITIITGLFGAIFRDVLLQDYGIYAFQQPSLIVACVITALVVFYFGQLVTYITRVVDVIDSLSLGMWGVITVGKALSAGLSIVPAVMLAAIASVGGGIVRDALMGRPINAFQPGSLYGTAAVIGSTVFALMKTYAILPQYAPFICLALVAAIRMSSLFFGINTKPSHDLSMPLLDAMSKPVEHLKHRDD